MTLALSGLMLTALLAACGSTGSGHCEAYGGDAPNTNQVDQLDIKFLDEAE